MFVHNIDSVLFSIGPVSIRYYPLAYILGAIVAYFLLKKLSKEKKLGMDKEDVISFVTYALLGIVIGARLGYVLFYNLSYYLASPLNVFAVWQGGMSFHGGLIGAIIAAYLFCKKKKIDFWKIADITVIPVAIALFLGRVGNFINAELYGRLTNVPWAVKFPNAEGWRHPSQLYEALKNIVLFSTLWLIRDRKMPPGFMFWLFITMYGVMRFIIEFFRQPDGHIGLFLSLSRGQWLCAVMVVVGAFMLYRLGRQDKA